MKIAVGGDRSGFALKTAVLDAIRAMGHEVVDFGSYRPDQVVDFPDVARSVCGAIQSGDCQRGLMFCGTGVGAAIACNKVPGMRAAVCHDIYSAHQCVEHDDVQVMCLGGAIVGPTVALELIELFLNARFAGTEEFRRRLQKLEEMELAAR
jgi:ribose 5-phosphate isomerase B